MPFERPFIRVTANGSLSGTTEIFSFGFNVSTVNGDLTEDFPNLIAGGFLDLVGAAISAFFQDPDGYVPFPYVLETVKFQPTGVNGKWIDSLPVYEIEMGNINGGVSNALFAPQVATVVTLISGKRRDPGKYNRFYVPTAIDSATGTISPTRQNNFLVRSKELLDNVNDALTDTPFPAYYVFVMSNTTGGGFSNYAEQVMTGQVYDTQRRRRNKLPENYATLPIDII